MLLRLSLLILSALLLPAAATEVANGKTAMVILDNAKQTRLTYEGKNIPLLDDPADPSKKIALIPIGYRTAPGNKALYRISGSNKTRLPLRVVDGGYPHESLKVAPSKVHPNKKQNARVGKEYHEAMKIYNHFTPKRYWDSLFSLPMSSHITSAFGTARLLNGSLKSFHSGTDFKARPGTPVQAVNDGVVVLAKNRYFAGNSVVIDHGEGLYTCYYHLSRIDVKAGQKVTKGEMLGLSGSTGRVTGPHLHFAVMLQGVQVDPMQLLATLNSLFDVKVSSR